MASPLIPVLRESHEQFRCFLSGVFLCIQKQKQKSILFPFFFFLLNNISWISFSVSKYKTTSFYKKWLHGILSRGNNTGNLNHPLPMRIWVVSNCFDTVNNAVYNLVHISFCTCASIFVKEILRSGIFELGH